MPSTTRLSKRLRKPSEAVIGRQRAEALLGTIVRVQVVGTAPEAAECAIDRAFGWFREVESRCTRFSADSELMRATSRVGAPVPVSPLVFETLQFALAVAEATGGAFDPTVGMTMAARGFDREHRTGRVIRRAEPGPGRASYRDVELDSTTLSVTVHRSLVLDLGAVAKGLALDLAARELRAFEGFAIDAGGDLYLGGLNAAGRPWSVGIRDPDEPDLLLDSVCVSDMAVCTSGGYERQTADGTGHHLLDSRTGRSAAGVASVTTVAPTAMVADAMATAAFALGPVAGLEFLTAQQVEGLIVAAGRQRHATTRFPSERARGHV